MNVLLDTTYLMPAIGVSVSGARQHVLRTLRENGHHPFISELTLFELSAKGAKYIASHELDPERVRRGITAVTYDEALTKIPLLEGDVIQISFTLRGVMNDYLDCVILSSAICSCEAIVTEDRLIHGIEDNPLYKHLIEESNPHFKIIFSHDLNKLLT